jgi:hypothetical protein
MNNQIAKGFWKIAEDYPTKDGCYIVALPASDGSYYTEDCDVWEFRSGAWYSLPDSRFQDEEVGFPDFYLEVPMPRKS